MEAKERLLKRVEGPGERKDFWHKLEGSDNMVLAHIQWTGRMKEG